MTTTPTHDTSPSAIKALAECPEKFFLGSVQKDPRRFTKTTPANVGILVHDVLARETIRLSREVRVEGAPLVLERKALLAALAAPIPLDAEPQTVEARLDLAAVAGAREILKTVARMVDLRAVMFRAEAPGVTGTPIVEERVELVVDGVRVLCVFDRQDGNGNAITVVDYKTGADVLDRDELRLDPQAGLYGAAARALWPNATTIRVAFHYLQRDVWVSQEHTPEIDEWARQTVRDHMSAVAWYEKRAKWPTKPGRACADCPFRKTCRGYTKALATGELVDLDSKAGLEATAKAFGEAKDTVALYEKRERDLAESLRGALVERGESFPAGGRMISMGKRNTPKFPFHAHTLKRAAELTGLPLEELTRDCLVISSRKLDEKIDALDMDKATKRAIKAAIDDTGTLDVATWVEARKLKDPFTPELVEEPAEAVAIGSGCAAPDSNNVAFTPEQLRAMPAAAPPEPEATPALAALPEGAVCPRTLSLRHWASAGSAGNCAVCGAAFVAGYEHPVSEPNMVADLRPFQAPTPSPHAETGLPPPKPKRSRKAKTEVAPLPPSMATPAAKGESLFVEKEAPKAW